MQLWHLTLDHNTGLRTVRVLFVYYLCKHDMARTITATFSPIPELEVSITVSYVPPPGSELGPNEYRAASGPVTVTCTAVGGTGPVSYQWTSTCRDCPFQTENSKSVTRAAVHSSDIGNHTCTATSGLISGSKTISFDVVGKQDAVNVHALVLPI